MEKSDLEQLIDKKAERMADKNLSNAFEGFKCSYLNGNGRPSITFNDKCGELAGKAIYREYHSGGLYTGEIEGDPDITLLEKYTNWPEIKEGLVKKYKAQITDQILGDVDTIRRLVDGKEQ
ncbi:hypothetical protein [Lactobacillus xujianguonis]|uniref:hypothetical protein n=1 Tax=Lactobacillus xujianguonis TaxID=2495899 RepID=UPI000FD81EF4|nr:hypothetical protein [Lactobacillus xujianguonis]RVU73501.1 hypothetical protein EJK20_07655 [Lactobacillus xujianguonis]